MTPIEFQAVVYTLSNSTGSLFTGLDNVELVTGYSLLNIMVAALFIEESIRFINWIRSTPAND